MIDPCIFACDPGISGAIAFYFPLTAPKHILVEDVPVADGLINGAALGRRLRDMEPTSALIELVGARPGQGVSSMFNFGRSFGTVIGVVQCSEIPLRYVTPGKWKRHFGLSADKEEARGRAINLFPACAHDFSRKKDAGRAEAALLALYAAEVLLPIREVAA